MDSDRQPQHQPPGAHHHDADEWQCPDRGWKPRYRDRPTAPSRAPSLQSRDRKMTITSLSVARVGHTATLLTSGTRRHPAVTPTTTGQAPKLISPNPAWVACQPKMAAESLPQLGSAWPLATTSGPFCRRDVQDCCDKVWSHSCTCSSCSSPRTEILSSGSTVSRFLLVGNPLLLNYLDPALGSLHWLRGGVNFAAGCLCKVI